MLDGLHKLINNMFFNKPKSVIPQRNVPPPWENIDSVPSKIQHAAFSLTVFTSKVTGFGMAASRVLLVAFSAAFVFIAYALYLNLQHPFPMPPHVERQAIDASASSSLQ